VKLKTAANLTLLKVSNNDVTSLKTIKCVRDLFINPLIGTYKWLS